MKEDLEPLEEDVMAVLRQLGPVATVAASARDRVWNAVAARVALVPGGGGGGPALPPRGPSVPPSFIARNPWLSLAAALAVGGAIGAIARGGATGHVASAPIPVAAPAMSESPTAAPAPHTPAPWTELEPAPSATLRLVPTPLPPSPPPSVGQTLAAESAILDIARTAIARGEGDHALAAVERHAAAFPHGSLREEREALAVKALVLAGRGDEARARAAKFRTAYPESLFLQAIESSLRSIP
jgi:hypothetical protein